MQMNWNLSQMTGQSVGSFLRLGRKDAGLSQAQLAQKLNISTQYVSGWENGRHLPPLNLIKQLCEILCIREAALAKKIGSSLHDGLIERLNS